MKNLINKVGPIDINIIFNEDIQQRTGRFQNLYAHFDCFKMYLHKNIQGYFIRSDE
ncbi:MAG: hypothetical protein OHK0036_20480 [Bacteroidia bacterium]